MLKLEGGKLKLMGITQLVPEDYSNFNLFYQRLIMQSWMSSTYLLVKTTSNLASMF